MTLPLVSRLRDTSDVGQRAGAVELGRNERGEGGDSPRGD